MPEMGAVDQEGIARRFWIKSKSDWIFAMYSPFFLSLASGNLDSHTFLNCVSQDVHFLKAFAQAYELAEECADDDEDKSAIRKLRKRVKDKLKNYETIVREWGFELPAESNSIVATAKYTDFLLATASGKVEGEKVPGKIATPFERIKLAAYTLGAMAPCMRLFAHISNNSAFVSGAKPCQFQPHYICDFDMTCTAVDSFAVLAEIAIITAPKLDLSGYETKLSKMSSADLRSTWGVLSAQYVEEHDQCIESIMSSETGDLNVLQVHSNELAYEETISTGEILRRVECPMEKLQAFNDILKDRNTNGQQLTVYIGGSVGDLLCLLKADIGIVIGSSPSLSRLGDHFGISFVPLFSGMVKKQKEFDEGSSPNWKGLPGILYTVSSWAEIHLFWDHNL
ncbi:hypothetical protein GH714_026675 [Hevea brasiliensis]|uniref:Thiaminase-2/PQQC domain-containing protein n=1 Tax=Hevea brasiliensis TaxID=3981 RepID=A0A6A6KUI8_HEVBR|nr:hypothetical protein GH714_026675 [Hevea brasiliensis]